MVEIPSGLRTTHVINQDDLNAVEKAIKEGDNPVEEVKITQ